MATIYDSLIPATSAETRREAQHEFGRHIVEHRNRMARLVREWIEAGKRFPTPIYDRLIDKVRELDPSLRHDIASISLLMADQIIESILMVFDCGDETTSNSTVVNYAIVAQFREPSSDDINRQVDINRGQPVIAMWTTYKKWLSRYAPSEFRA